MVKNPLKTKDITTSQDVKLCHSVAKRVWRHPDIRDLRLFPILFDQFLCGSDSDGFFVDGHEQCIRQSIPALPNVFLQYLSHFALDGH
jgi:hypothetical protein